MNMELVWARLEARLAELKLTLNAASKIAGVDLRNIRRAAANGRGVSAKTIDRAAVAAQTTRAYLLADTNDPSLGLRTGGGGPPGGELQALRARHAELLAEAGAIAQAIAFLERRQK